MPMHSQRWLHIAPALLVAALLSGCGPATLAETSDDRLTVAEAAQLIADHSRVAADSQVVRVVAELWVDYSLLAAQLGVDTTLATLDVDLAIEQPLREITLAQLRDAVIEVDTVVTSEELADRFAADLPGARATASQILLLFPPSATSRQRDSVETVARAIHDQLRAGADFATMATRHSDDPGSGSQGGRMGTFGRGEMLPPVDSAVFALRPGETSGPVASPLGYHVLRLEAVEVPNLSEVGDEFRARIQQERMAAAEAVYVAQRDSAVNLVLADGAVGLARALLESTPSRLSPRAADRPLATWENGAYTTGDFLELARVSADGVVPGLLAATDADLRAFLRQLARQQLLVAEAVAQDFQPTAAQVDSLAAEARAAILSRADRIGLIPRPAADAAADGEDADVPMEIPTPQELVRAALIRVVSGEQEILPLGGVTFILREAGAWRIHETAVGATLEHVEELRSR